MWIELQSAWSRWDDIHRIFTTRKRTHIHQDQVRVSFRLDAFKSTILSLPLDLPFSIQGSKRYSKSYGSNFLFQRYLQKDLVHYLSMDFSAMSAFLSFIFIYPPERINLQSVIFNLKIIFVNIAFLVFRWWKWYELSIFDILIIIENASRLK